MCAQCHRHARLVLTFIRTNSKWNTPTLSRPTRISSRKRKRGSMSFVCFYFFVRGKGPSLPLSVRSSTTDIFQSFDTPKENLLYMHVILALLSSSWVQKKKRKETNCKKKKEKVNTNEGSQFPPKNVWTLIFFFFLVGARPPAELTKWKWGPFFLTVSEEVVVV